MPALETDETQEWVSPSIRCTFGPYFKLDAEEQLKTVTMVQTALGAGKPPGVKLLTKRAALAHIAPIFGIENVDAALDSLTEETQGESDQQHERDMQLQHSLAKTLRDGDSGSGAPETGAKEPPSD